MIKQASKKTAKQCTIVWDDIDHSHFIKAHRSNILQSPDYGRAMAKLSNQKLRNGLIQIDGQEAGFIQILEAGIFKNALHALILDRGPLWFEGFGRTGDFEAFMSELRAQFPKRFGRRMRFIPEMKATPKTQSLMHQHGFKVIGKPYETIWLDLRPDIKILKAKLKKNWRNALHKSEQENMQIIWSDEGKNFAWLLKNYEQDKKQKNYDGPSLKTLIMMAAEFSRGKNMLLGTAMFDETPIAAILIFIHGHSATYQIGYTADMGRKKNAHYMLLWQALERLKERNIYDFDLGGVNEGTAKGVKDFKSGMGGQIFETLGLHTS